jgi:hypothetical protein
MFILADATKLCIFAPLFQKDFTDDFHQTIIYIYATAVFAVVHDDILYMPFHRVNAVSMAFN